MSLKIVKRNGEVGLELADGVYHFEGDITIGEKGIEFIDNGVWSKPKTTVNGDCAKEEE